MSFQNVHSFPCPNSLTSPSPSPSDSSNPNTQTKVFNTALFLNVPKYDNFPTSPSPQFEQSSTPIHNFLPIDLLDRIERISPANNENSPNISRSMSDIEMQSKSDDSDSNYCLKEEEEDYILSQCENIKISEKNKRSLNSLSTTKNSHKSSVGSCSSNFSSQNLTINNNQIQLIKLNLMNNMNDAFNRKASLPQMPIWNFQQKNTNCFIGANSQTVKQKKKQKKKKKKERDEFTIEMFGRRGWICEQCNNFNYDSRNKCNRCGIPKQPKKIVRIDKNNMGDNNMVEHKGDWTCGKCNNINYAFRLICNRCQMPREEIEKVGAKEFNASANANVNINPNVNMNNCKEIL